MPDRLCRTSGTDRNHNPFSLFCALLQLPCALNQQDVFGKCPVHYAVLWGPSMVQYLVLQGANIQAKTSNQRTALHMLYTGILDRLLDLHYT